MPSVNSIKIGAYQRRQEISYYKLPIYDFLPANAQYLCSKLEWI